MNSFKLFNLYQAGPVIFNKREKEADKMFCPVLFIPGVSFLN